MSLTIVVVTQVLALRVRGRVVHNANSGSVVHNLALKESQERAHTHTKDKRVTGR
jgi:hypothetical protein